MKLIKGHYIGLAAVLGLFSVGSVASEAGHEWHDAAGEACVSFGPQSPRDIDSLQGENERVFTMARSYREMNLCNIHFHKNAEHKAKDFSIYAGNGDGHGYGSGYQCTLSKWLNRDELAPTAKPVCKGEHGGLKPGDTIEVHWVYSTCDVKPWEGLGSCMPDTCKNPELRVETQVFTLANNPGELSFSSVDYIGHTEGGLHQTKALPSYTGKPVEFIGSTTGPSYSEQTCSPLQVTWSVRPQCAKLDINTLGQWCENNVFKEDHAHGVRKLVTNPKLLSRIK